MPSPVSRLHRLKIDLHSAQRAIEELRTERDQLKSDYYALEQDRNDLRNRVEILKSELAVTRHSIKPPNLEGT